MFTDFPPFPSTCYPFSQLVFDFIHFFWLTLFNPNVDLDGKTHLIPQQHKRKMVKT